LTPDDFVRSLDQRIAPGYLFLGPEASSRDRCRTALMDKVLTPEDRAEGFIRHDLDDVELNTVLDDARSFSLFAANRVIWVTSAESALPRGRAAAAAADEEGGAETGPGAIADYLRNPTPGTVLVFDSSRFEFEGEDKTKMQRLLKYFSAVPAHVEFERLSPAMARRMAGQIAKAKGLKIGEGELDLIVEVLAADGVRITQELEKLALYAVGRQVTEEDIWALVPNAKGSTVFNMVAAIGRRDRAASLESLDVLVREGEYLPLALTFLATQFRLALVARENGWTTAGQIQAQFTKAGTQMWRSRAEQVAQTVNSFSTEKLKTALKRIAETDVAFRDARPDDRTVMERFVLALT
jgi:DNA polymerase-3 subunit delta